MRDHVEGDLLGKFARRGRITDEDVAALLEQLVHPLFPRAGDRLVCRYHHPLYHRSIVERFERDDHLRGRAIRVGDDHLRLVAVDRIGVHFGHHQRHIGVHPEQRGIVDHHAALTGRARSVDLGHFGSSREQRDIPAGEIEILDILDLEHPPGLAKFNLAALRTRRGDGGDLINRKLALGQHVEHFAPNIPGRADDDYPITHCLTPWFRPP